MTCDATVFEGRLCGRIGYAMRLGAYAAACTRTSRVQLHDDRNFYNPTTSHSLLPQHSRLGLFLLYTDI